MGNKLYYPNDRDDLTESHLPPQQCGHRPNDGRQTMRLTIDRKDLSISPEFEYRSMWQRSDRCVSIGL
jgi:hypothetical protein